MGRVAFAQNFEDVVLLRALGGVRNGHYLDIGAQHPIVDSVSQAFYREGWRGIHVEPSPQYAALLRENRPDEVVIQALVGNGRGLAEFYCIQDTGLSTGNAVLAQSYRDKKNSGTTITVPQITLNSLLEKFSGRQLHWLKIDVEGMESEVLASWGSSAVRPWVLVVESIHPETKERVAAEWQSDLEARGYHAVLFDGVNTYFVADEHADLDGKFVLQANCLDDFSVFSHHWAAANTLHLLQGKVAEADARADSADQTHAEALLELEDLALRKAELEGQLEKRDLERGFLKTSLDELRNDRDRRENDLAQERQQTSTLTTLLSNLADQIKLNASQAETLHGELRHLQARDTQLSNLLEERSSNLSRSVAELGTLKDLCSSQAEHLDAAATMMDRTRVIMGSFGKRLQLVLNPSRKKSLNRLLRDMQAWREKQYRQTHTIITPKEGFMVDIFSFDDRSPYHRASSLDDLLRFVDVDFVRCAFVTILGRQPDPDGEAYYLAKLRRGYSKLTIIRDLRRSSEGRRHDPGIAGLDRSLRAHRLANMFAIVPFIRKSYDFDLERRSARQIRALRNSFELESRLSTVRAAHSNHRQQVIMQKLEDLQTQIAQIAAGQVVSADQVQHAEGGGETTWAETLNTVLR